MPKIKIDHIVSFSSEDNVHVASNILNNDMTKKWKSQTTGEPSVSVILQLEKATKISGVDICNESSAFVEVLVGRSSSQAQDFKPILIMSSFMTPMESRDMSNCNRVRLFTHKDLAPDIRDEKWDRVKFNCTQPFNKRVQYGLCYMTLYSPQEEKKDELVPVSLGKFTLRPESPDVLSAGSLFAKRKEEKETPSEQMRKISSKEWLDKHGTPKCQSTKLQPSSSSKTPHNSDTTNSATKKRNIDLFYDSDDDKPHDKIDKVIAKKKQDDEMKKEKESKATPNKKVKETKKDTPKTDKKKDTPKTPKQNNKNDKNDTPSSSKRKAERTPNPVKKKVKLVTKPFNRLMDGVVFTISGIVNPERADLRQMALEMGAIYKPNWDNTSTHLICAFANTPKFKEVQGKGKIVTKSWIRDCHTQRKRLPWRRFALDRNDQGHSESEEEICEEVGRLSSEDEIMEVAPSPPPKTNDVSGSDTEDEVERILAKQKKQGTVNNNDPFDAETDEEKLERDSKPITQKIPKIFDKQMFYVDDVFSMEEKTKLEKLIRIVNGYILDELRIVVDYIITDEDSAASMKDRYPDAKIVSAPWVIEVYNSQKLVPLDKYLLT